MKRVDLNADVGEGFDDDALLPWITSATVACGYHAGDASTMERTVKACLARGVSVGAHPGLLDQEHFGRTEQPTVPGQVYDWVVAQVTTLDGIVWRSGDRLRHVKLHGALYHMTGRDEALASETVSALRALDADVFLLVPPGSVLERVARDAGLRVAREGFPERGYLGNGALAPRSLPGAVVNDPAAAALCAVEMVMTGRILALDGAEIPLVVETLCIHGDAPNAAAVARAVREGLEEAGVHVTRL